MVNYVNNGKLYFVNGAEVMQEGRMVAFRHGRGKHAARVPATCPHSFQANKENHIARVSAVFM